MTEFKVGDKIKRVKESDWPEEHGVLGEVYTVLEISPTTQGPVVVAGCGGSYSHAFELVKEEEKPVVEFKVGDRVRRVTTSYYPKEFGVLGEVYTVLQAHAGGGGIEVIPGYRGASQSAFELVEGQPPEYEVGKSYLWFGGDCPLPEGTAVSVRYGTKDMSVVNRCWASTENASTKSWQHKFSTVNIVMFQVISYPKPEPVKRSVTLELTEEQLEVIEDVLLKHSV